MKPERKKIIASAAFFVILTLSILPLFLFPLISMNAHAVYNIPSLKEGILDLEGYHFDRGHRGIPLNGEWEFFWNRWIVTDGLEDAKPDLMAPVPSSWTFYKIDGEKLPEKGFASYRIRLVNCPQEELVAYVPKLASAYRIFFNGKLQTYSGELSKNPKAGSEMVGAVRDRINLESSREIDLVIEVSSWHAGGLYMTPMLAENEGDYARVNLRYVFAGICMGISIVTIVGYFYIACVHGRSLSSIALLILDVVLFLRLVVGNEFFDILKMFFPFLSFHEMNILFTIVSAYLPPFFLLAAKNLCRIQVSRRQLKFLFVFDTLLGLPMYLCVQMGYFQLQALLGILSLFPVIPALCKLYKSVREGVPHALTVSAGFLFLLSSLVGAILCSSGLLVINLSLYPPACFVIGALFQDFLYIRRSVDVQKQAIENANLRVRLRESEMSLMLSQIRPHFLYNALIAIQVLCTREPEAAEEAIIRFARYLRANMQSLTSHSTIPFSQELEHIRNYTEIEKLRFKDRLNLCFEIETENFQVPPLTIQPLVENAIKHGACKNVMGGTVTLKTYERPECYCVEIRDDGPGFDPSSLYSKEGSYGLKNVSFRLKEWIGARMRIESGRNKGTVVTVAIPKGGSYGSRYCG